MPGLEIVWRNPDPPHHQQRWEQLTSESQAALYEILYVAVETRRRWDCFARLTRVEQTLKPTLFSFLGLSLIFFRGCQRLQRLIGHWAAKTGNAAEQLAAGWRQAGVGLFQHMVLLLFQISKDIEPFGHPNVARLL